MTVNNQEIGRNKNIQKILKKVLNRNKNYYKYGSVVSYIPALKDADSSKVGVSITDVNGDSVGVGDYQTRFSVQSISKILVLILALLDNGEDAVFNKVGMEPSGKSFNALESINDANKPYNPLINAGAIAVTSMIKGRNNEERFKRIINFFRKVAKNNDIELDNRIYLSEKKTGTRNRTLAYHMKETGIIEGRVEKIVDLYFKQCSILVTCTDLANIAAILANNGVDYETGEQIIPKDIIKLVRALMMTCGLYNESGKFAVKVGLPGKSGVGGGMIAIAPQRLGIGVYGPALDENGNSVTGLRILADLSDELDLSIL